MSSQSANSPPDYPHSLLKKAALNAGVILEFLDVNNRASMDDINRICASGGHADGTAIGIALNQLVDDELVIKSGDKPASYIKNY